MIIGIGTDIVEISRIETTLKKAGDRFVDRILTANEKQEYKKSEKVYFLSKRFASKEALSKALGTGISGGVSFLDFEVSHNDFGAPMVRLSGVAKVIFDKKSGKDIFLSLSDEKKYSVAFAIMTD